MECKKNRKEKTKENLEKSRKIFTNREKWVELLLYGVVGN